MTALARTLLAGLVACPVLGFSQGEPLFQFSLYFEDAIGNQDSIILGYDSSASSQHINPQFGEVLLVEPFDSIFEVRAIHGYDDQNRTTKKAIEDVDLLSWDSCALSAKTKIVINAKYPPVKITYDSTLFPSGTCRNVVLSPHWGIFTLPEWWNACEYYCMGSSSAYITDLIPPGAQCWNYLYVEKEVEGQGLKQLPGLFLAMFYGPGPCNDPTFLAAKEIGSSELGRLSPNPVRERFAVQLPWESAMRVTVSDVSGSVMDCPFTVTGGIAHFDASALLPGVYVVLLQGDRGRQLVCRFLKI